jgi:20S proteasome subunit alpha 6
MLETCPSGNYFDWKAQSIGARSQSAKTYLEKHYKDFENASRDELIRHGLSALRETLSSRADEKDKEPTTLSGENCALGIVGEEEEYHIIAGEELQRYVSTRCCASIVQSELTPV